jgi:murein DD-endopeptidase MepM/ murein hydrolase activator NlpD
MAAAKFGLAGLAVALPLGIITLFFAVAAALALNAEDQQAAIPPELEAIYHQVGARTGVSWALLAAWDGAENGYALPVPSVEQIYAEKIRAELERKRQQAEDWCKEHPEETSKCPPPQPELTPGDEAQLWRSAYALWRSLISQHVETHAQAATPFLAGFDQDTEGAYRHFLSADRAGRAAELLDGYLLLESLEADADQILITPTDPPADWQPVDGFAWPAVAPITSRFGMRISPIDGVYRLHAGVDLGVATGTPIRASKAGTVVKAEPNPTYGLMVVIDHGDGYETLYAHNSGLAVTVGQHVEQGQVVTYSGSTGLSTGPHLHFEVHYYGAPVDPLLMTTERSGRE